MKELQKDLRKNTINKNLDSYVPLTSHVNKNCFVIVHVNKFDNGDNVYRH